MLIDNSNIKQKIKVRQSVFKYFNPPFNKVIDFYAGEGELIKVFWSKLSDSIIAVEKNENKLQSINLKNVINVCDDNTNHILLSLDASIIDCDAYGVVFPFIRKIRELNTRPQIIFFTDGENVYRKNKHNSYNIESEINQLKPDEFHYEKAEGAKVYYGYLYYKG